MSKADMRAIVDVHIDFCTQDVLLGSAYDCHQTDEWKDPQEGKQDCLMDRVHLCGNQGDTVNWDFTSCLFINQFVTTNKTDNMKGFNQTVEYCSNLWGLNFDRITECAYSDTGARLLQASHKKEIANNHNTPEINWIVVNLSCMPTPPTGCRLSVMPILASPSQLRAQLAPVSGT
jgi:hypothetical protein